MSESIKLFIVEGEERDYRYINRMTDCFFKGKYASRVINLPTSQNIYMLYKKIEEYGFDADIVEIIREIVPKARDVLEGVSRDRIDEVFLFFDYDYHQNNLSTSESADKSLQKMLEVFDNETDNGKLYISYPMIEAIYDYKDQMCQSFSNCLLSRDRIAEYKNLSGNNNPHASIHFDITDWKETLQIFVLKASCLFEEEVNYAYYREEVTPLSIYRKENVYMKEMEYVFILSALPEFLFDYYKEDFWNSNAKLKKFRYERCDKENIKDKFIHLEGDHKRDNL